MARDRQEKQYDGGRLMLELEPRILLSADINPAAQAGILAGINSFQNWVDGLNQQTTLAAQLPGVDRDLISLLNVPTLIQTQLVDPIENYFAGLGQGEVLLRALLHALQRAAGSEHRAPPRAPSSPA